MQGIRPRHGHLDLCRKNWKTAWNAFELGIAGICKVFSSPGNVYITISKDKNGTGDLTRPMGATLPLMHDFPLGHPSKVKFKHVHARTNLCNCNKPVCDSSG